MSEPITYQPNTVLDVTIRGRVIDSQPDAWVTVEPGTWPSAEQYGDQDPIKVYLTDAVTVVVVAPPEWPPVHGDEVSLHPTKTRLALLREVLADNVIDGDISLNPLHHGQHVLVDPIVGRLHTRVTDRIGELERAGWVELPEGHGIWRLTDAGRAVLAGEPQ